MMPHQGPTHVTATFFATILPDDSLFMTVSEMCFDTIIPISFTILFLLRFGRGWTQCGGEPARLLPSSACCRRKATAANVPWKTRSATAAGRHASREEKHFLMDVFKQHVERGHTDRMMQVLQDLENRSLSCLNSSDYHCLVQRLAKGGNPTTAHQWLRRFVAAGFQPSHSTFNDVISSYIKKRAFAPALEVVGEMRSAGLEHDTATYNMIIDIWARKGDAQMAQSWMRKMLDEKVQPNIIGFSSVMRACAEAGLLQDLEAWVETTQEYGFQLDLLSFRSVIRVFARKSDATNALKWLEMMSAFNVQPGIIECMEVCKPIMCCGDVQLAARLFDQMRAAGVQPTAIMLNECIVLAAKSGHHDKAETWAQECAARKMWIAETTRGAMMEAGLAVPVRDTGNTTNSSLELSDVRAMTESTSGRLDRTSSETREAARRDAIGRKYQGVIRESNPYRYGFITCPATYSVFQSDVWFSQMENKENLTKGQRVSFRLRVDEQGRPRACDLKLCS